MGDVSRKLAAVLERFGMTRSPAYTLMWMAVGVALIGVLAAGGYRLREALRRSETIPPIDAQTSARSGSDVTALATVRSVVWRDRRGNVYRATVDRAKLDRLMRAHQQKLEAARQASRDLVVQSLQAGTGPIFAALTGRIADYADWYYSYLTKYLLMGHAVAPALDFVAQRMNGGPASSTSLITHIRSSLVRYMTDQYAARVLHPISTAKRLETAFNNVMSVQRAEWTRLMAEYDDALAAFLAGEEGHAERLAPQAAQDLALDWDGQRTRLSHDHEDIYVLTTFRRGALYPIVIAPRTSDNETSLAQDDSADENADEIARVLVDLFSKVVDPILAEAGNAVAAIVAGGIAGGVASGGATGLVTAGAVVTVPIGATIGLATTIGSDVLTNRLEESLARAEFERNLRQTMTATQQEIETKMADILYQHFDGWYEEILGPLADARSP